MRRRDVLAAIATWPYALAVVTLLVNDWCLKSAYPGLVTGKLSDFAGLAVVAVPLLSRGGAGAAALPRRRRRTAPLSE